MDPERIRAKFGQDYVADDMTFIMGIDQRFTRHFATRYRNRRVLETCTGAGFTTIALAREAEHVVTVEIDPSRQMQARENIERSGLADRVTFVLGDSLDGECIESCLPFDSAFLDPDWAASGPGHVYRFRESNTRPPADTLLQSILRRTSDVALVLPPFIDLSELAGLPGHEFQRLYLDASLELYCLYFGALASGHDETELRI